MVTIPTLSQLYNDVLNDLQSQYSITIPVFGKVFLRALAAVQAAKLKLYYLGLANIQKNIWPDTADSVSIGGTLERFGLVKIQRNPFPAVAAQYTISITGVAGSFIAGFGRTQLQSDVNSLNPGVLFTVDNDYTCTGTGDTLVIRALTTGTAGKLNIGDTLTFTAPIGGVTQSGNTVTIESVQPLDAETIEEYRAAVIYAFQSQPQGGSATDYRLWAAEVSGVEKVYPYASSGNANEIDLYIESNIADSMDGHGTPSGTMITNVSNYIEGSPPTTLGKRPLGVFQVNYLAVTPQQVDINISGSSPAFTIDQQTAIIDALTSWINTVRPYIAGAEILADKNDIIDLNNIILQTLSAAPGTTFGAVTFKIDGVSYSSYRFGLGFIPYINNVTFV